MKQILQKVVQMAVLLLLAAGTGGCGAVEQAETEQAETKQEETAAAEQKKAAAEKTAVYEIASVWTGKEENIDKAVLENGSAVVKVADGTLYGSGVLWSTDGEQLIVVTNQHVIREGDSGSITFADGTNASFSVLFSDAERDVAFLGVRLLALSEQTRRAVRLVSCSAGCYEALESGSEIGLVGTAGDGSRISYIGEVIDRAWAVSDFEIPMLYVKSQAEPGMSGGGMFDAHGHYVGMLTGGNGDECAGVPFPVLWEIFRNF
ncbi:MAG: trypsin-like peptidase domain-containing protein [Lachnospiraceae bacterium]|nr:trypsin-like peptidase domain-containing protein [Lachnospiraceae bacterium]